MLLPTFHAVELRLEEEGKTPLPGQLGVKITLGHGSHHYYLVQIRHLGSEEVCNRADRVLGPRFTNT